MIIGGYETSASAMAWTLYELARHPDHQERIRTELAEFPRQRGGAEKELTPQDYDGLVFFNAVIKVGQFLSKCTLLTLDTGKSSSASHYAIALPRSHGGRCSPAS